MILLLRYWREGLIAVLILAAIAYCHARDEAIADRAKAEVRTHTADSVLSVTRDSIMHLSAAVVHDTVTVSRLLARWDTVETPATRDTIYLASDSAHLHPLVPLPAAQVETMDTLVPACRALTRDCAAFRRVAQERFDAYELKIANTPHATGSWKEKVAWGIAGVLVGRYVHP